MGAFHHLHHGQDGTRVANIGMRAMILTRYSCRVLASALVLCAAPVVVQGQDPWPVGIELAIGVSRADSDNNDRYRGARSGMLLSLLATRRLHDASRAGPVVGVEAGGHGINIVQDADCRLAPDGGCMPWFPSGDGYSLLAGWESAAGRARFLAGPTLLTREPEFGVTGRLDLAMERAWRLAVVWTATALLAPSMNGDRFLYGGVGAGIRLR